MKVLISALLLFAVHASAADLILSSGESAIIQPNVTTKVSCGGSQSTGCSDEINGLKLLIENCKTSYSASYCADKYWPDFKASNPKCALPALSICIDNCKTSYSASYCADKCSQK